MPTYNGQYTQSKAGSTPKNSSVTFGADISQATVYLDVDVIASHSFARLMLALGRVVRMRDSGIQKDHSAYQAWVKGEYLKELDDQMKDQISKLPDLLANKESLSKEKNNVMRTIKKFQESRRIEL